MEEKVICTNRVANHEYFILDRIEAGIVLEGGEVKSLRQGNANLKDSFCVLYDGQIHIKNMHIALYDKSGVFNTKNSRRDRKLLLHKEEIYKIKKKVEQDHLTIVPTKAYFSGSNIKVEIAVARGKKLYDKRESLKQKELDRKLK